MLGHLAMALGTLNALYAAFALIAVGNGLFKPSMASRVSQLYAADDPRREAAFYIFYLGVNLGGLRGAAAHDVRPQPLGLPRGLWSGRRHPGAEPQPVLVAAPPPQRAEHGSSPHRKTEQFSRRVTIRRFVAVILMSSVLMAFWIGFNQQFGTLEFWTKSDVNRHDSRRKPSVR